MVDQLAKLFDIRFKLCNRTRDVSHTNTKREGEHLGAIVIAAFSRFQSNNQLILAADHCGRGHRYLESVDIASKCTDLCAVDAHGVRKRLALDTREGVGKEYSVTGKYGGHGRGNVKRGLCLSDGNGDMLHCNVLVIIAALDHIEYDVGSHIGCGGDRFLQNRSVNDTAVVLAHEHSVFQRTARGGACANERLRIAIVDQILNSGGLCQNGSCFSNGKAANLKFGHSLVVIALGHADLNGVGSTVCGDGYLVTVLIILHGDLSNSYDSVLCRNGNRFVLTVIDEVRGVHAIEIILCESSLRNGHLYGRGSGGFGIKARLAVCHHAVVVNGTDYTGGGRVGCIGRARDGSATDCVAVSVTVPLITQSSAVVVVGRGNTESFCEIAPAVASINRLITDGGFDRIVLQHGDGGCKPRVKSGNIVFKGKYYLSFRIIFLGLGVVVAVHFAVCKKLTEKY